MPHRKPTRDSGLVWKIVSHNYNHLSPRGDLGGQYLVHIVKKVLIWPSPLHNTVRCPLQGILERRRGNCGGDVCISAECEAGCHCINTMLGTRDGGNTLEPGTAAGTLKLGAGGVGAATLRSSKSAPDSGVTVRVGATWAGGAAGLAVPAP